MLTSAVISFTFHLANETMLTAVGHLVARTVGTGVATSLVAACIVAVQAMMVPVAIDGRTVDYWGRKPIFVAAFAVLVLRGALYPVAIPETKPSRIPGGFILDADSSELTRTPAQAGLFIPIRHPGLDPGSTASSASVGCTIRDSQAAGWIPAFAGMTLEGRAGHTEVSEAGVQLDRRNWTPASAGVRIMPGSGAGL